MECNIIALASEAIAIYVRFFVVVFKRKTQYRKYNMNFEHEEKRDAIIHIPYSTRTHNY